MLPFYKRRRINEIGKEERICLIGKVAKVGEDSFLLEDETGMIEILSSFKVEKGKVVRVFAKRVGDKFIAEIIQDFSKVDLNLFKRVEEVYNEAGLNV